MEKISVVLIEDQPLVQTAIKSELSESEELHWFGVADDGIPGVALITEKQPDVAIVDYHLKELGGLDLIQIIHRVSENTRIISLTQEKDPFLLLQIIEAGSKAIILKEFRRPLKKVVQHVFNGGSILQEELGCEIVYAQKERQILNELNDKEKHYFEKTGRGEDHASIAVELGIKENSVKKLLTNSKNKLHLKTKEDLIKLYKKFYPGKRKHDK